MLSQNMAGLYIHIPLCASKCAYCDFYSVEGGSAEKLVDALKREMEFRRDFAGGGPLDTIYIGGGTPTLLAPERLQELLDRAAELWDTAGLKEVTVEANPEDLTDGHLAGTGRTDRNADGGSLSDLMHIGFNRLSIGVQSFDDGLLRLMRRRHDARRAKDAVRAAQDAGFDNISVDLIYGIPGMTAAQWERTLDEAVALGVQHISAYHLTIEPGTLFGKWAGMNAVCDGATDEGSVAPIFRLVAEEESRRQYGVLCEKLAGAGFEHYEISNFALPGRRAVHNSAYWSGRPYLGVGPSAHSFDGGRRREWVVGDTDAYIAGAGTDAIYEGETLSDRDLFNERVMTSLRCAGGLDIAEAERSFGRERTGRLLERAKKFIGSGLLVAGENGSNIAIPPDGFLLSDYVISTLFDD